VRRRIFTREPEKADRVMAGAAWVLLAFSAGVLAVWIYETLSGRDVQFVTSINMLTYTLIAPLPLSYLFRSRLERRRLTVGDGATELWDGVDVKGRIRLDGLEEIRIVTKEGRSNLMGWKSVTLTSRSGGRIVHACQDPAAVKDALVDAGCPANVRVLVDPKPENGLWGPRPRGGTRVLAWLLAAWIFLSVGLLICMVALCAWRAFPLLWAACFLPPGAIVLLGVGEVSLGAPALDRTVGWLFVLVGALFLIRFALPLPPAP